DRPVSDPDAVAYVGEWDPGFRAALIAQRLAATAKADIASTRTIQTDFTSLPVERFKGAIAQAVTTASAAVRAQDVVREWSGNLAADLAAPAIHEAWLVTLAEARVQDTRREPG